MAMICVLARTASSIMMSQKMARLLQEFNGSEASPRKIPAAEKKPGLCSRFDTHTFRLLLFCKLDVNR